MLPTQLLSVLHKPRCVCVRGTRPSSRARRACPERSRRDGAPPRAGDASEIKSLGPLADVSIFSISLIPMEAEPVRLIAEFTLPPGIRLLRRLPLGLAQ